MTLKGSKLLGGCNQGHIRAIPDKDSTLARSYVDEASRAIIYIEVGSDIKNKILTICTIFNVVLLLLDRVYLLDFKGRIFIDKSIVIRVVLFLWRFGFEDVGVKGRFWKFRD